MTPGYNPNSQSAARRRIIEAGRQFERRTELARLPRLVPDPRIVADVQAALDDKIEAPPPRPRLTPIIAIQHIVALHLGVPPASLRGPRRTPGVVLPRQTAMWLAKWLTVQSTVDIGRRFGGRDHTTVLHGIRQTDKRIAADAEFAATVAKLLADCRAALNKGKAG